VADAGLDLALAVGVPDPARQRHDAVVGQHVAVERVQCRVVDVRGEHALEEVVEDHDAGCTAQPAERLLVQFRPGLGARLPREQANGLA
jgi:hypothetical protein